MLRTMKYFKIYNLIIVQTEYAVFIHYITSNIKVFMYDMTKKFAINFTEKIQINSKLYHNEILPNIQFTSMYTSIYYIFCYITGT